MSVEWEVNNRKKEVQILGDRILRTICFGFIVMCICGVLWGVVDAILGGGTK